MTDSPETPPMLASYPHHRPFPTRWADNDVFGHVNNVIYYAAMDSTVTHWLLTVAGTDPLESDALPVVIASSCRYIESGSFPETFMIGLRADKIGGSSVSWGLGIFRESDSALLATGSFVHVFVDRVGRRPTPVPPALRALIEEKLVTA